ncbi:hypothetical protein PVL29_022625 [Vitis rotundifolia]|uniref:Carbonic anhydrase n=1 Tax=Vitis rotundifolia TaxID=103349 RepID=A0AA39DD04_VITRO|nr:hypothetical protein PVL29_022625 [Vitis rotundifolia]
MLKSSCDATIEALRRLLRIQMNIKNLQKASTPRYDFLLEHCLEPICPSHVLNFKPGEAFMVRNIANMSHIFKVNTHLSRDFIDDRVKIRLPAKAKESADSSLVNLLSYPYVGAAVAERDLKLVGGYYNFVHGTFGLWEVDVDSDIQPPEIFI